jgi:hypothetical protein
VNEIRETLGDDAESPRFVGIYHRNRVVGIATKVISVWFSTLSSFSI